MDTNKSLQVVEKNAQTFLITGNELLTKSNELKIEKKEDTQAGYFIVKSCQLLEKQIEDKRLEIVAEPTHFVRETNRIFRETFIPISEAKAVINQKILAFEQEQEKLRKLEEERLLRIERERLAKLEEERLIREQKEKEKREAEEEKLRLERERLAKAETARIEKEIKANKLADEARQKMLAEQEKQRKEREELENQRLAIEREKREIAEQKRIMEEAKKAEDEKRLREEKIKQMEEEDSIKGITKLWTYDIVDEAKIPVQFCSLDSKKINKAIKAGIREIAGLKIYQRTMVK